MEKAEDRLGRLVGVLDDSDTEPEDPGPNINEAIGAVAEFVKIFGWEPSAWSVP